METILALLKDFSPVGTIALALFIIYQLIRNKGEFSNLKENHLHEIQNTLSRIEEHLTKISDNIIYIKTKINGPK